MEPLKQLLRLDKPIGIWLLFLPASWAVGITAIDFGDLLILEIVMLIGAFVTRSAGCIMNDLTDQKLDREVARTKNRPLAAGTIKRYEAIIVLANLLFVALLIAIALPNKVLILALIAVPMMAAYPWMKRLTNWPQLFLGFTFNLSVLMGWAATNADFTFAAYWLYIAAVIWTLAYDTIYAVQDIEDDTRIGILSSARTLGITSVKPFVTYCYIAVMALFVTIGILTHMGLCYYLGVIGCAAHARWQINQLPCTPEKAGALFRSNQWFGLIYLGGILLERMIG